MSFPAPTVCANSECREAGVRQIHCSSQSVAFDSVDGASVFAHHVTYRCPRCGHTWAVQGYSPDDAIRPAGIPSQAPDPTRTSSRGW